MKKPPFYPTRAGDLTEEERIAICAALYPEQANKTPENRALWPGDRVLTAPEKMAWSRYVRRPPATRYDLYPAYSRRHGRLYQPTDPILWALRMRRAGLARRLLEEKGALDWVDASRYAPWTLRWSPSLLKLILDLAPAGEPLGCSHRFVRTGGDWKICVNATLLTAAAALDDIESVELLLQYGYDPAPEPGPYGHILPEAMLARYSPKRTCDGKKEWWQRHNTLPLDIRTLSMSHDLFLIPTDEGFAKGLTLLHPHVYYYGVYVDWGFQPLSAALLCGAPRCALRMLEFPRTLNSWHVQATVSYLADFGIAPFRETLDLVMDALGCSPEQFVEPGNWEDLSSHRHPVCLRKHNFYTRQRDGTRRDYTVDLMRRPRLFHAQICAAKAAGLPMERFAQAWSEHIRTGTPYFYGYKHLEEFQASSGITLILDRDAVLPGTSWYELLHTLEHAAVGPPPKNHLSAMAALLFNAMLLEPPFRKRWFGLLGREKGLDPMYEILHSQKAVRLLLEEPWPYVEQALTEIKTAHPERAHEADALRTELMVPASLCFQLKWDRAEFQTFWEEIRQSRWGNGGKNTISPDAVNGKNLPRLTPEDKENKGNETK